MRKLFQRFSTVTTKILNYAINDSRFNFRHRWGNQRSARNDRIKMISPVTVINISLNRPVNPRFTILRKQKFIMEGIIKSLNVIECFL